MPSDLTLAVNGNVHRVRASAETPLLYVLRNELGLRGPRFGCGLGQCGACSVLIDGKEARSCITPVASVRERTITTLEGLDMHPLQQAWIDAQVPQCGYCQNGMLIQAAELLATTPNPSDQEIGAAMRGHLCRCGTYPRVLTAIHHAAAMLNGADA